MTMPTSKQEMVDYIMSYYDDSGWTSFVSASPFDEVYVYRTLFPKFQNDNQRLDCWLESEYMDEREAGLFSIKEGPVLRSSLFKGQCTCSVNGLWSKIKKGQSVRDIILESLSGSKYFESRKEFDKNVLLQ